MTTSPNSSAEAWRKNEAGSWSRPWKRGTGEAVEVSEVTKRGFWGILERGELLQTGSADSVVLAMEAADLAIAELERKG